MKVVFDIALDGPAFPGPAGTGGAYYGEAWVGPEGLLGLLETQLGLSGRSPIGLQRTTHLAAQRRAQPEGDDEFWRESFRVDPIATCRRLLHDRDLLTLWGWTGQGVSPRLAALATATADALPGTPDRLRAVVLAVTQGNLGKPAPIASIKTYTPIELLPPLWTALFEALRAAGVTISIESVEPGPARGDLAAARQARFAPTGDGSLSLVRRYGALDAADQVAASLAARDSLDGVVIVGADAVLDEALRRHGLPGAGQPEGPTSTSRLLHLVIETAFHPMEMSDLHALLVMQPGPIPRVVGAGLVRAIQGAPGRGTATWKERLDKGLSYLAEGEREGVAKRIETLLQPVGNRAEPLSRAVLDERIAVVRDWASARVFRDPSLREVVTQTEAFTTALDALGDPSFTRDVLRRLCDDLGDVAWTRREGEAGLQHVPRPGAVLGAARVIVWWNFSRSSTPAVSRLLLTEKERAALRGVGVTPPDAARTIAAEATAWRRPLLAANEALLFICPETDEQGEHNYPHPLWDEITAGLNDFRDAAKLHGDRLDRLGLARSRATELRPLVQPALTVELPGSLSLREVESPSSVERLLGCSVAWTLRYPASLKPGLAAAPATANPLLFGSLTHALLAEVFGQETRDPDRAAALAEELFDRWLPTDYEILGLPRYQVERATVRRTAAESARALVLLANKHHATIAAAEREVEVVANGQRIRGWIDLLWTRPDVVLDMKWGKTWYQGLMKYGTQVQLAAYAAAMDAAGGSFPETAYFVLLDRSLLVERGGALEQDGSAPGTNTARAVWASAVASLGVRISELSAGRLEAPGASGDDVKPAWSPAGLQVAPRCNYCEYAKLCGRSAAR